MNTSTEVPNTFDPVAAVAECLAKLNPAGGDPESVEAALRLRIKQVQEGDLSGLEAMLTAQAHLLNALSACAAERYRAEPEAKAAQVHSAVALKAQTACRLTVEAIRRMKKIVGRPGARPAKRKAPMAMPANPASWDANAAAKSASHTPASYTPAPHNNAEEWIKAAKMGLL